VSERGYTPATKTIPEIVLYIILTVKKACAMRNQIKPLFYVHEIINNICNKSTTKFNNKGEKELIAFF
jgi:hypothetical protein